MPYTCFQETHIPIHPIVTVSTQINRKSPAFNIKTHSNSATRILHSHGYTFKQCCSTPKAISFLFRCSSLCLFWVRVDREKESNKWNVSANKPNFGAWMIEFCSMPERAPSFRISSQNSHYWSTQTFFQYLQKAFFHRDESLDLIYKDLAEKHKVIIEVLSMGYWNYWRNLTNNEQNYFRKKNAILPFIERL